MFAEKANLKMALQCGLLPLSPFTPGEKVGSRWRAGGEKVGRRWREGGEKVGRRREERKEERKERGGWRES
jgi:hypothetical protein